MSRGIPRDRAFFEARTKVDDNGCWVWQLFNAQAGHKRGGYYGRTCRQGEQRPIGAHVLAHEVFIGPIPEGLEVDHTCLNTLCCNPDHLEAVTPAENNRRKWASGNGRNQNTGKNHCPKCGELYSGESRRGDGRTFRHCVPCMKAYQAAHYAANRERIRAQQNAQRKAGG